MKLTKQLLVLMLTVCSALLVFPAAFAQDADADQQDPLAEAHAQLESALQQVDNLFYRQLTAGNGARYYQLMWEAEGEVSKISVELRELGKFQGKPVYGVLAYTVVAQNEGSLPPAVIKAVATRNERTGIGHFSMNDGFDTVYMNFTGPSDTLTAGQLWMIFAYMHDNRVGFKQEIAELTAASGR